MKKLESSFKNMIIVLTAVTAIAGVLLGYVNELTKDPIAQANAKALSDAISVVIPGFDNNPAETPDTVKVNGTSYIVYKATKDDKFIGAAVQSSENGFGGALTVLVGFDPDGNIIDYSLLSHAETPGLGSKAADWFKKGGKAPIIGMNPDSPLKVRQDGGDIDAITASTITSRAFLNAVNKAYQVYKEQNVTDGSSGASRQVNKADVANVNDSISQPK